VTSAPLVDAHEHGLAGCACWLATIRCSPIGRAPVGLVGTVDVTEPVAVDVTK
jgi:hypothetical protein